MTDGKDSTRPRSFLVLTVVLAAIAIFAVTALLINIFERKQEARNPYFRVVELNDTDCGSRYLGQELSHAVRSLPAHPGHAAHQVRRE